MTADRYIGLISGTSMDGIDAVVVDFAGDRPQLRAGTTAHYGDGLREALDRLRADPDAFPAARLARLDAEVADAFADAALRVLHVADLPPSGIRAIGSHGQTVLHRPEASPPHTLQIGDPSRIAAATGIDVVADLRRADLAAGGQGAPLAPLIHSALLADPDERRVVVNLGGIANITVLDRGRVSGFDTGPANCFLDDWYRRHHDDRFDTGGGWASSGTVDETLLERLVADDYFAKPPPKSTGIEYFSPAWLHRHLPDDAGDRAADVQATLAEFAAATLVDALRRFGPDRIDRVLLCGGGVANDDLVARVRRRLGETPIQSTAEYGIDPDFVEATLIAWLAREFVEGRAIRTGPITGAAQPVRLGALWPGR